MPRATYVLRNGELVLKSEAYEPTRSGPHIISDHLNDVVNPVNGRTYDSKSAYHRAVRDAGCVVVGNDSAFTQPKAPTFTPSVSKADIAAAWNSLRGL